MLQNTNLNQQFIFICLLACFFIMIWIIILTGVRHKFQCMKFHCDSLVAKDVEHYFCLLIGYLYFLCELSVLFGHLLIRLCVGMVHNFLILHITENKFSLVESWQRFFLLCVLLLLSANWLLCYVEGFVIWCNSICHLGDYYQSCWRPLLKPTAYAFIFSISTAFSSTCFKS